MRSEHARKKGNISIMVAFILALVSLLALLSASYVRDITNNSGIIKNYYQAYYLANAGIEAGLVAVNEYNVGFEEKVESGNTINDNFNCRNLNCYFTFSIISRTHFDENGDTYQTNNDQENECNEENAISLERGETYSIPLFYDSNIRNGHLENSNLLSPSLDIEIENIGDNDLYAIGISLGEGATDLINRHKLSLTGTIQNISINDFLHNLHVSYLNSGETITNNQLVYTFGNQTEIILPISQTFDYFDNYLIISNNSEETNPQNAKFCIKINNDDSTLPRSTIIISSQGNYNNQQVGLQATKKMQLPDFLFNTFLER